MYVGNYKIYLDMIKSYTCDNCGRVRNDKPCIVCGSKKTNR